MPVSRNLPWDESDGVNPREGCRSSQPAASQPRPGAKRHIITQNDSFQQIWHRRVLTCNWGWLLLITVACKCIWKNKKLKLLSFSLQPYFSVSLDQICKLFTRTFKHTRDFWMTNLTADPSRPKTGSLSRAVNDRRSVRNNPITVWLKPFSRYKNWEGNYTQRHIVLTHNHTDLIIQNNPNQYLCFSWTTVGSPCFLLWSRHSPQPVWKHNTHP